MISNVTFRVKIPFDPVLLETMREYSKAAQYVANVGAIEQIYNKIELHHLTYYEIRERCKLPAQLVCSARDKAVGALKGSFNPRFKRYLTIRYDARSFSFEPDRVSLATINGRRKFQTNVPECYKKYLTWKIGSADLIYRNNSFYLHITVSKEIDIKPINGSAVGVDLGINNIAVTSNRQFFKGIRKRITKYQRLRQKLQSKGTRSAKRHLKMLSGKEKRFQTDVNHCISKRIVERLRAGDWVVMEDLNGIRKQRKGKALNRLLHNWSFYQLQSFIEYKALIREITTVKVSPRHTSKTCNRCGEVYSERPNNAGFFKCLHCGYSCNSDFNAALNLRARLNALRNSRGLYVDQPIVASSPTATSHLL